MLECNVDKKALGPSACNQLPALIRGMIETPINFFLTEEDAADPAAWQAAMFAAAGVRIHLWPNFIGFENVSEEAVYEDLPLGLLHVRDGNYRFRAMIKESLCLHKKMFTHRNTSCRVFLIDVENQIIGTQDSDGNFRGLTVQLLNTEKLILSDGTVSTKSPIYVALANNKELDKDGAILDGAFVNTLTRLTDAKFEVVSASDTEVVFTVKVECDGTDISGLLDADFEMLDEDGADQSIAVVENEDGTYTATGVGLVSGTIGFGRGPELLTVEGYVAVAADVVVSS